MEQEYQKLNKKCLSCKAIIIISIIAVLVIVAIIIGIVVGSKDSKNTIPSFSPSYYLSEKICNEESGKMVCYRKINVTYEHYIFDLSEDVKRTHVSYLNRYGIKIVADLYTPKNLESGKKYSAIVVGPPFGGVKEQGPGVYSNELAKRGFISLAFDPSFNGESGGENRKLASSDIFAEDFSAGVDYLGNLSYVNRERIGGIGICASGGFILGAAAIDGRIKAVVTSAMYDIPGFGNNADKEQWQSNVENLKIVRWKDVDNGFPAYSPSYVSDIVYVDGSIPTQPEGDTTPLYEEWNTFYSTERGHHARSTGGATDTSSFSLNNFPVTYHIGMISPRPILLITGDIAHSKSFSESAYQNAEEPKEIYVAPNSTMHIDLYDDVNKIPFDKIEDFFKKNLLD